MFWVLCFVLQSGWLVFEPKAVFSLDVVLWRCNRRNAIMTAAW
jgi:hypothetical protein